MTPAVQAAIDTLTPYAQSMEAEELNFATSADVALRVMRAVDNPDVSLEDLARIVMAEPLLSAKVMRMANSAALNPSGRNIADLKQAVMRVGIAPIRSLAMALTLDQLRHSQRMAPCRHLANRLWERSVHVAALAYVVARRLSSLPADDAMLAGIVHDLGRFYLLGIAADKHPELLADQSALIEALDKLITWPEGSCSKPLVYRNPPLLQWPGVAPLAAICRRRRFPMCSSWPAGWPRQPIRSKTPKPVSVPGRRRVRRLVLTGRRWPISSLPPATKSTRSHWRSRPETQRIKNRHDRVAVFFVPSGGYIFG
jgi:hypothetical protein